MSSATEAEITAIFINTNHAITIRNILEHLGHPQPPTRIKTDSETGHGILHNTMKQ